MMKTSKKLIICLMALCLMLSMVTAVSAAVSTKIATSNINDITQDFVLANTSKVPILTFTLTSNRTGNDGFSNAKVNYSGSNKNDISKIYLYKENGSIAGFDSLDILCASKATSGSGTIFNLGDPVAACHLTKNIAQQFYIVADVKSSAVKGNIIDAFIVKNHLTFQSGTWPNIAINPSGYSKISEDKDLDGYYNSAYGGDDCNDDDASVYPGAAEICNGIDDNCNAETDEGYNLGESCFSNPNSCGDTEPGNYVCSADGLSSVCDAETPYERGNWNQECVSEANSCGDTSIGFTDCDGLCNAIQPDERFDWNLECTSDANSCGDTNLGFTNCDGTCLAEIPDERESWNQVCASLPNECGDTSNGLTDCGGFCNAEAPIAIDSDSDGTADCNDECASDPFKSEAGICGCGVAETDTDEDGTPDCIETDINCDGIDNDGNGFADDGYVAAETFCGTGACASTGLMQCVEGIEFDSCVAGEPSEETCNNIDDNCNGQIDDGENIAPQGIQSFVVSRISLTQSCYTGPEETKDVGVCIGGTQTCSEGSWEESCSGEVLPAEEICDGLDNNCDGSADEGNFTDTDADGIKDCVDDDNDNDGVADSEDVIEGNSSDIKTNVPGGLLFFVDDAQDEANHAGIGNVKVADSTGFSLVEFEYDFANALNLGSINITLSNESGFGSLIIKGINLSGQNTTKTAYIARIASSDNLCIIDNEVDSIVIEGDCSNGIKLSCPGTNGNYSCELADNNTRYKVSGLKHSAVSEYIYIAPTPSPAVVSTGGSSGELIVVPHNVPKQVVQVEEAPAEEIPVEEAPAAEEEARLEEEQVEEQPATRTAKARARLGQITGQVVTSVKKSPGAWGSGFGIAIAISLITAIYISTRKVNKRFYKN